MTKPMDISDRLTLWVADQMIKNDWSHGETVRYLADQIGVKRQTVYAWLNGTQKPSKTTTDHILNVINPNRQSREKAASLDPSLMLINDLLKQKKLTRTQKLCIHELLRDLGRLLKTL